MLKYIIVGLVLICSCFGKTPRQNALIVAEFDKNDRGTGDYVNLVLHHFTDGDYTAKDTVIRSSTRILNFEDGNSFVYRNRYVITAVGSIIDIQTKTMLKSEPSNLYETRGDSLIFHNNMGYFIYDLNKKNYDKVKDYGLLNLRGILSPNHRWGLKQTIFPSPRKIILYDSTYKQDTIISDCGIGTPMSKYSSIIAEVPCCWIDNDNFLYAYFQSNDPISESSK